MSNAQKIEPGTYVRPARTNDAGFTFEAATYIVVEREDGKIGLTHVEAQGKVYGNRNRVAKVQWFKPNSPTLTARLRGAEKIA